MRTLIALISIMIFASCQWPTQPQAERVESHAVVGVFKKRPISIHDEISPRYAGILDNGDTISVSEKTRPGDTIVYKFYQYVEKR